MSNAKHQKDVVMKNLVETPVHAFEVGKVYEMRFIGDNDLRPRFKCIGRTAKSATFERLRGGAEVLTRRIKTYSGAEYVLEGSYSMAPSINAKNAVAEYQTGDVVKYKVCESEYEGTVVKVKESSLVIVDGVAGLLLYTAGGAVGSEVDFSQVITRGR